MDTYETDLKRQLREREKELDALYKLSMLFTEPELSPDIIFKKTSAILKESIQYQNSVDVNIYTSDINDSIENEKNIIEGPEADDVCSASSVFSINKRVTIFMSYSGNNETDSEKLVFLDRERYLARATAALLANVLQKGELENILRQSTMKLQRQTEDLENKNIALKEIMFQYGMEKKHYQADTKTFLDSIIYPEINKILQNEYISEHSRTSILNIRASLENKFGKSGDNLIKVQHLLTPREFEICNLIKNGMTTKEISSHLNISELTVERHRNTIRKKLTINNSSINLTSFLRNPTLNM